MSIRNIFIDGGTPWGFRITQRSIGHGYELLISKVRARSKAQLSGLKERDLILYINQQATQFLSLQEATEIIDSSETLNLIVKSSIQITTSLSNKNISNQKTLSDKKNYNNNYNNNNSLNTNNNNRNNSSISTNTQQEYLKKQQLKEKGAYSTLVDDNLLLSYKSSLLQPFKSTTTINNRNKMSIQTPKNSSFFKMNQQQQQSYNYFSSDSYSHLQQQQQHHYQPQRNYYSAAESCAEETDDDTVFDDRRSKRSFASITLKQPPNYFSDTEGTHVKNSVPRGFYKAPQQPQASHVLAQPTMNNPHYQLFKVPKIQEKLKPHELAYSVQNRPFYHQSYSLLKFNPSTQTASSAVNSYLSSNSNLNSYESTYQHQQQYQQNLSTSSAGSFFNPDQFFDEPITHKQESYRHEDEAAYNAIQRKYELEIGADLMKQNDKPQYSDSYFYNSSTHKYPTIQEQKKLARQLVATLEGSDPQTSKYHKNKNKEAQLNELRASLGDQYNEGLGGQQQKQANAYVFDENLPSIIRNSIQQAEQIDPIQHVHARDEFKELHFTEHTTHTEMPPQIALQVAASLNQSGGRGAQIFQKRKAKSDNWIVDESTVSRRVTEQIQPARQQQQQQQLLPQPQPQVQSNVLPKIVTPIVELAPLPVPKHSLLSTVPRDEQSQFSKFTDFNVRARGWIQTGANTKTTVTTINPVNEPTIRQGLNELSLNVDSRQQSISQVPFSQFSPAPQPTISKVKLNKLNTHDDFFNENFFDTHFDDSQIAASDL